MLPAADFITMFKSGALLLLLLEPLFSDKAVIRLQRAATKVSNPPDDGTLRSLPHINKRLEYIFAPFPLWQTAPFYRGSRV